MAVNKKSLENLSKGKPFSHENQPENRGRRPSVLKHIKDSGISITDVRKLTMSLIWDYGPGELKALLKDKDNPPSMGEILILNALIADQKSNSLTNYEKLMDRSCGKPTQSVDLNNSGYLAITSLTPEERKKRIKEILKKGEPKKSGRK